LKVIERKALASNIIIITFLEFAHEGPGFESEFISFLDLLGNHSEGSAWNEVEEDSHVANEGVKAFPCDEEGTLRL